MIVTFKRPLIPALVAFIIAMLILSMPNTACAESDTTLGDANGDGAVTITDYTLVRLDILGLKSLASAYRVAADVNSDGSITITDYTLIRLHILGLKSISSGGGLPLSGRVIGIDAGHQLHGNYDLEPMAPGSSTMKAKVSSGTQGRFTRVPEYVVNLEVALKLKEKLEALGAVVIMTRETHDVDISNAERAMMMNNTPVDCWIRIHANGNDNPAVYGMCMLVPAAGCMNTSDASVVTQSVSLGQTLLNSAASAAGAKNNGLQVRDDQTGFCWSSVPVCTIEMGYMTNETEDNLLVTGAYQDKIAEGLALGFITYFTD
ncbi:MAG: N-acetylmuramoyl-L-alanine amidase [Eubacteriales bacterium]|nr:N-acetylmuramoyl-L-alanine amidase [Eubacteriales bacterium]